MVSELTVDTAVIPVSCHGAMHAVYVTADEITLSDHDPEVEAAAAAFGAEPCPCLVVRAAVAHLAETTGTPLIEAARWHLIGVTNQTELVSWRNTVVGGVEEAVAWVNAGARFPHHVRAWHKIGVSTPDSMACWKRHGFDRATAQPWIAAGVHDPGSVTAWRHLGVHNPAVVSSLITQGYTVESYRRRADRDRQQTELASRGLSLRRARRLTRQTNSAVSSTSPRR